MEINVYGRASTLTTCTLFPLPDDKIQEVTLKPLLPLLECTLFCRPMATKPLTVTALLSGTRTTRLPTKPALVHNGLSSVTTTTIITTTKATEAASSLVESTHFGLKDGMSAQTNLKKEKW